MKTDLSRTIQLIVWAISAPILVLLGIAFYSLELAPTYFQGAIPEGSVRKLYGNIISGGKFGATIGKSKAETMFIVENEPQDFTLIGEGVCSEIYLRYSYCKPDQFYLDYYSRNGSHRIELVLVFSQSKLIRIVWNESYRTVIDF